MGQDGRIGRYLTPDDIRLGLWGLAAGCLTGVSWRLVRRVRWGAVPFLVAVLGAAHYSHRSDWFRWDATIVRGAVVILMAGLGGVRLLAIPGRAWVWVAAGALFSAAGVWAGVPETGPALLVGGALSGLALTAVLTGAHWGPSAGVGMVAVLGWAALSGAAGRPWAVLGGALCTGLAPWWALLPPVRARGSGGAGPWLLGGHMVLVILAARWIGVIPQAGWWRVAVLGAAGLALAVVGRRRA